MLNVWRSVSNKGPIQQFPLAVCAANSLKYPDDFVVFEIQYKDRIGENWFVRDSVSAKEIDQHHHQWFYYPKMKKSEALIFKQVRSSSTQLFQPSRLSVLTAAAVISVPSCPVPPYNSCSQITKCH